MTTLKDPITIRKMEVKNRWGLPPMLTFSSDPKGCPSDKTIMIYEQKARGGVGLITFEATAVDTSSVLGGGGAFLGTDDNISCYKKLTDIIHKHGAKIGVQLAENGIIGFIGKVLLNLDVQIFGPSKVDPVMATSAYDVMMPDWTNKIKETDTEIIEFDKKTIIRYENEFADAAKRAIQAGFDFVEIHSAHGTTHASFLAPYYNKRTDEYGGTLEKRTLFTVNTIKKIRKSIGEKPPIFVRISADELLEDGNRLDDSIKIAKILEKAGTDCLDVSQGNMIRTPHGIQIPTYIDHGEFVYLAEAIKKEINIPVITVGRITDPKMADEIIQQGKADIVYTGRQLICDPETPNKYFSGQLDDIMPCLGCLQGCNVAPQLCVYDAFGGRNYQEIESTTEPKKIVILGAGIAGMEAARVAKIRGHDVSIYEKSDKVGGIIPIVAKEYKKEDFIKIINYLKTQLKKLNIPIYFNKILNKDDINSLKPDILVLACGSTEFLPDNFKDSPNVFTQEEAILKTRPLGKNIVIRGVNTYWKGGVETAITLSEEGYNIKAIIGPGPLVASDILWATGRRFWILNYFKRKNIPIYTKAKILDVLENGVKFIDNDGKEQFIEADTFIYCGARRGNNKELKKEFKGIVPEIVSIGDGKRPSNIQEVMKDAQKFARKV